MTDGLQKQSQAFRIAVVGAVVCAFTRVAMKAQGLQILNKIRAVMLNRDNVIDRERTIRTTAQADVTEPGAHRKPITPAKGLPFHFGTAFVLIHPRRNTVLIPVRLSPRLRQVMDTLFIVLIPTPMTGAFQFRVIQSPIARFLTVVIAIVPIRSFLYFAVMFWVISSALIFSLKYLIAILMVVRICFGIYLIAMKCAVLGFLLQPFIAVLYPLITAVLDMLRGVLDQLVFFFSLRENKIALGGIPLFAQISIARFAFSAMLARLRPYVETIKGLIRVAQPAFFAVKEGELYNTHVNLHKRLAMPAGVSAPRGLFARLNYSTFVASDQGFSALGGFKCLWV